MQELVNLLLTGEAVSNVFNDVMELDSGTGDCMVLRGISARSDIGLLSLFEHYGSCQVGRASYVLCFVSLCFVRVFHPMSFFLFPLLLQCPPPPPPPQSCLCALFLFPFVFSPTPHQFCPVCNG